MPSERRSALICALDPLAPALGVGVYSEFVSWHLLGLLIEAVTEAPFEVAVSELILRPLALEEEIFFVPRTKTVVERICTNVDVSVQRRPVALKWEVHAENLADCRPAGGAYASMRGLAELYASTMHSECPVLKRGASGWVADLHQFRADENFDPILGRSCQHGVGFMIMPEQHGLPLHRSGYGHTGLGGMTVAFADPFNEVVIALHLNGIANGHPADPVARRRRIVGSLFSGVL